MGLDTIQIPDYRVTQELYKEPNRSFFAAVRESTAEKVILKVIPAGSDQPYDQSPAGFAWLNAFQFDRILNARRSVRTENDHITELDNFDGILLQQYLDSHQTDIPTAIDQRNTALRQQFPQPSRRLPVSGTPPKISSAKNTKCSHPIDSTDFQHTPRSWAQTRRCSALET